LEQELLPCGLPRATSAGKSDLEHGCTPWFLGEKRRRRTENAPDGKKLADKTWELRRKTLALESAVLGSVETAKENQFSLIDKKGEMA